MTKSIMHNEEIKNKIEKWNNLLKSDHVWFKFITRKDQYQNKY